MNPIVLIILIETNNIPHHGIMIVFQIINRYTTVLLGMFALDYFEISFTETVKSTAPAFTVIISRMLLGKFHWNTKSIIPYMKFNHNSLKT